MNESQRQFYLKHCGITLWYSREPLAGAAPSITFEFLDDDIHGRADSYGPPRGLAEVADVHRLDPPVENQTGKARLTERRTAPVSQKHSRGEAVSAASQVQVELAPKPELNPPAPITRVETPGPTRFAVDLRIASTGKLVLIAEAGGDLPVDVQNKLLMQISRALGQPATADGLRDLVWPVFANRNVPGNDDAGLSIVLKHVLGPLRSRTWVGLGSDVEELMAMADQGEPNTGPRLAFTHGLNELAVSAAFKRQLWHVIRDSTVLAQL